MKHHLQRGQALVETAIVIPLFLLLLFAVIWVAQTTVLSERAQIAVRYSGLIANQASPYNAYSLYSLYNNVGASTLFQSSLCAAPNGDAFTNSNTFPGPVSSAYWTPDTSVTGTCAYGTQTISGGALPVALVFTHAYATVATAKQVPPMMTMVGDVSRHQNITAQQNFLMTPDLGVMMSCFPDLHDTVSQSLAGEKASSGDLTPPDLLPAVNPTNGLTPSC